MLSFNVTAEELFDLFGKFGPVRYVDMPAFALAYLLTLYSQVRQGIASNTKGTAFVVYEDVVDAKSACDKLNGFNFQSRYLVGTSIIPAIGDDAKVHSIVSPARQDAQGSKRSR